MHDSRNSPVTSVKTCGFAALVGAILLAVGIVWLSVGTGAVEWISTLPGMIGMFLTTASLIFLYPLITVEGSGEGAMWAALGIAVTLLSLAAMVLVVLIPASDGVSRLLTTGWIIVFWIRPLGAMLFAFALVRSDILFGRALHLFAIGFIELPLLANLVSGSDITWTMLVFGVPDLHPGLISTLLWAGFGYSMLLLGRENGRDVRESGIPPAIRP